MAGLSHWSTEAARIVRPRLEGWWTQYKMCWFQVPLGHPDLLVGNSVWHEIDAKISETGPWNRHKRNEYDVDKNIQNSSIHNSPKQQTTQVAINRRVDKQIVILYLLYVMECYLATERDKLLAPLTIQINLKTLMLNKARHKRVHTMWFQLYDIQE